MSKPKIGDKVKMIPMMGKREYVKSTPLDGTITYVNEKHRFYNVLFDCGFMESYKW